MCRQEYEKNVENTTLSLGKKRWVEHFHDNHHRFSPEVALILIVQRRSKVCYGEITMGEFKVTIERFFSYATTKLLKTSEAICFASVV